MLTLNVMNQPIDQTWSIERIATDARPITWEAVFEESKHELHDVSQILEERERTHGTYYPLKQDIFAAFHYTPLNNVKVVILGQDPYHQTITINGKSVPRAVGLSFSVRQEDSIPSSLQNIYTELANSVRGFRKPDHGDLREWARQGVLLLNTCLTVQPGQAGSHGDIWLGFIVRVFRAIAAVNPNCVYMLWGREAQKIKPILGERSIILEAAHPSGLSARRGFFGCNHFNLANDALIRQGKVGINWRISTLSELRAPSAPITVSPTTKTAVVHQPMLTPVNVDMLPMIIPLKQPVPKFPQVQVPIPTVFPIVQSRVNVPLMPLTLTPVLPTIPNTKPFSPITGNAMNGITNRPLSPPTPVKPPTPPTPEPTQPVAPVTVGGIPAIPTINFGANLNTQAVIPIGLPQIITNKTLTSNVNMPNTPQTRQMPAIVGLPIIPALVK